MVSDAPSSQTRDLTWLLSELMNRVPGTRGALLLSSDGIPKYFHGLDRDEADRLAALASGLCSLSRGLGIRFGSSDGVRQVLVEGDDVMLFVTAAGRGSVLTVLAGREADVGVLGHEMRQLVNQVPAYLGTPERHLRATAGDVVR